MANKFNKGDIWWVHEDEEETQKKLKSSTKKIAKTRPWLIIQDTEMIKGTATIKCMPITHGSGIQTENHIAFQIDIDDRGPSFVVNEIQSLDKFQFNNFIAHLDKSEVKKLEVYLHKEFGLPLLDEEDSDIYTKPNQFSLEEIGSLEDNYDFEDETLSESSRVQKERNVEKPNKVIEINIPRTTLEKEKIVYKGIKKRLNAGKWTQKLKDELKEDIASGKDLTYVAGAYGFTSICNLKKDCKRLLGYNYPDIIRLFSPKKVKCVRNMYNGVKYPLEHGAEYVVSDVTETQVQLKDYDKMNFPIKIFEFL